MYFTFLQGKYFVKFYISKELCYLHRLTFSGLSVYRSNLLWINLLWDSTNLNPFCHCITISIIVVRSSSGMVRVHYLNTLRPRQNGRHFADGTFNRIFVNENVRISIKFSLTFVPRGPINNIPALIQIMAWHRPGDKPLSEPMIVSLMMHICFTRLQWVNFDSICVNTNWIKILPDGIVRV